jgi:EAL domain-containing protein (putative c-di-GMP-specific phosphodiesterase class I)/DNA-binding NarL/FixJ family response regulator
MKLLVLDDDPSIVRLIGRIAMDSGVDAVSTTDSETFWREYDRVGPDAIILDLQLGDDDGVRQLRKLADRGFDGNLMLISGIDTRVLHTVEDLASDLGLKIIRSFSKPFDMAAMRRVFLELNKSTIQFSPSQIEAGLRADEMVLHYQPIVSCGDRRLVKLEALVRWQHPEFGLIAPNRFVPTAETNPATIGMLTDWVVRRVARDYSELSQRLDGIEIAVNVSAHDLKRDLPDRLIEILRKGNVPPSALWLEITETAAFADIVITKEVLSRLRLRGIRLALDDFGTGYSSLKVLHEIPFAAIKVDRSFVSEVATSRDSRSIVSSIIDLANNMELLSIVEGVENEETAKIVETLGGDLLQGFGISQPLPLATLIKWADSRSAALAQAEPSPPEQTAACDDPASGRDIPAAAALPGMATVELTSQMTRLSPRQQAVMLLLAQGYSVKQIARRLELAIGTVKTHMAACYAAMGAHNRVEALRMAGLLAAAVPQHSGDDD